ncbi:MAG: hypothetical protein V9E99_13960 [Microthrixaceae bacterium]|jgi:MraZ protein|nr:hypothetical protein [Microthrixaceae bacterium]HMS12249.1 hypothetical protein [Microthrixaceae bacterium]HMT23758.1 hypothetical protein [Microthrixaceae bacterium]
MAAPAIIDRFSHSIDDKGRVVLPSAYREMYADGGVLSLRDDHLALYTNEGWAEFVDSLRDLLTAGTISRDRFTVFTSMASSVKPDGQGRISLASHFREFVGLERDAVFCGAGTYLGLYPPATAPGADPVATRAALAELAGLPL